MRRIITSSKLSNNKACRVLLPPKTPDKGKFGQPLPMTPIPKWLQGAVDGEPVGPTEPILAPTATKPPTTPSKVERSDFEAQEWMYHEDFEPGDKAPTTGFYNVHHRGGCIEMLSSHQESFYKAGETFRNCYGCKAHVRFHLVCRHFRQK